MSEHNFEVTAMLSASRRLFSTAAQKNVVLVDGCRIPFTLAGTAYKDYMAVDLGRIAMKGILTKTAIDPALVIICQYI